MSGAQAVDCTWSEGHGGSTCRRDHGRIKMALSDQDMTHQGRGISSLSGPCVQPQGGHL